MRDFLNAKRWKRGQRGLLGQSGASARYGAVAVLGAFLFSLTGCSGQLTLPAWLNIDSSQSTLQLSVNGQDTGTSQLEGGIYAEIKIDMSQIATGVVTGTIQVPRIEIATTNPILGTLCVAADSANPQVGNFSVNILTGASQTDFPLSTQSSLLLLPTTTFGSQSDITNVSFPLDISLVTGLLNNGEVDGLIQLPLDVQQDFSLLGSNATATINGVVTSSSLPPAVTSAMTACAGTAAYAQQTSPVQVVVNSKRTYLRTVWDNAKDARAVALANIGAKPGDLLRLTSAGSFTSTAGLPGSSKVAVAFSGSTLRGNPSFFGSPSRFSDKLLTGLSSVVTPRTFYLWLPTDIPQDVLVTGSSIDVTVPAGATNLFLTPIDSHFDDNFSTDLRVQIQVNP